MQQLGTFSNRRKSVNVRKLLYNSEFNYGNFFIQEFSYILIMQQSNILVCKKVIFFIQICRIYKDVMKPNLLIFLNSVLFNSFIHIILNIIISNYFTYHTVMIYCYMHLRVWTLRKINAYQLWLKNSCDELNLWTKHWELKNNSRKKHNITQANCL